MRAIRRTSEDRQLELIDAALRIIASKGIAELTTRSLADEVGLSTGAIFKHFASLEALLEAVVARVETVLDSTYPPLTLSPVERLERFIEARSSAARNQLGIPRLVLSEQFHFALPKNGSLRLGACVKKTRLFLLECIREGQALGELRTDVTAENIAPIVMGTVQMLALSPSKMERDVEVRAVIDSLLTLLRTPRLSIGLSPQQSSENSVQRAVAPRVNRKSSR